MRTHRLSNVFENNHGIHIGPVMYNMPHLSYGSCHVHANISEKRSAYIIEIKSLYRTFLEEVDWHEADTPLVNGLWIFFPPNLLEYRLGYTRREKGHH
jgi:hypothetical protein